MSRENQHKPGVEIVEFLKGEIEIIPLLNKSVDVIVSNCAIFLAVFEYRRKADVPADSRKKIRFWVGCIVGALHHEEYRGGLTKAGFQSIGIEPTRIYPVEDAGVSRG